MGFGHVSFAWSGLLGVGVKTKGLPFLSAF